jgi:hypothetical protein
MNAEVYNATVAGGDPTAALAKYRTQAQHLLRNAQATMAMQKGGPFEGGQFLGSGGPDAYGNRPSGPGWV